MRIDRKKKENSKDAVTQPAKRWVKLPKYCRDSGDTKDAVHAKRKKGIWLDGVETCVGPDGKVWVCPEAVYRWVESGREVVL